MTLKEKFDKVQYNEYGIDTEICEKIADDYAIEFAEWLTETRLYNEKVYSMNNTKELLEIFKKEKGLCSK